MNSYYIFINYKQLDINKVCDTAHIGTGHRVIFELTFNII